VVPVLSVLVFFLLLHQIEGHIVIPKLMGAAIAVNPLLVIFGIIAGAQIMGIGGVLLALPLLAVGREVVAWARENVSLAPWTADADVPTGSAR
jgi:predicted PurR-regulated permease PerM